MKNKLFLFVLFLNICTFIQTSNSNKPTASLPRPPSISGLAAAPAAASTLDNASLNLDNRETPFTDATADTQSPLANTIIWGLGLLIFRHMYKEAFKATGKQHGNGLLAQLLPPFTYVAGCTAVRSLVSGKSDQALNAGAIAFGFWLADVLTSDKRPTN